MSDAKLKLALITSQLRWGGGEELLFSLGSSLQRMGHTVLWVAPSSSVLMDRVRQSGMDRFEIAGRHPSPVTIMRLRREFKKRSIEIIHGNDTHAVSWSSMIAVGRREMKLIGVKHTVFPVRSATKYNWLLDRMVCVSQASRQVCLDSGILDQRLSVVHGGIAPPSLDRLDERNHANEYLGIDHGTPLLSAVGSLIPCKGYDTLIEAAALLREKLNDFCVVICGEGKERANYERRIAELELQKHVRLLGFSSEPNRWIAASDLFVHPTHSEGLSLVTIAAQMIGTPVVTSEAGGLREVMRCPYTSRPHGWIFASRAPSDLAELIEDALSNQAKRRQFIRDAQRSALERFSIERSVAGFLEVYHQVRDDSATDRSRFQRQAA